MSALRKEIIRSQETLMTAIVDYKETIRRYRTAVERRLNGKH
jgi:hypothetical protein